MATLPRKELIFTHDFSNMNLFKEWKRSFKNLKRTKQYLSESNPLSDWSSGGRWCVRKTRKEPKTPNMKIMRPRYFF